MEAMGGIKHWCRVGCIGGKATNDTPHRRMTMHTRKMLFFSSDFSARYAFRFSLNRKGERSIGIEWRSHRVPSRCFQRLHAWSRRQNSLHNGPRTQVPAESGYHSIQTGLKNVHCALQKYLFHISSHHWQFILVCAFNFPILHQLTFPQQRQYFPAGTPDQPFHPRHPSGPAPPERSSR